MSARIVAYGSLLGNSFLDIKKTSNMVSDLYSSLLHSIPYMDNAKLQHSDDSGRQAFIEQYWNMRQQMVKEAAERADG